jgi:hypothetical protein
VDYFRHLLDTTLRHYGFTTSRPSVSVSYLRSRNSAHLERCVFSSPRSHVNERRSDAGSLRTCRVNAATTTAKAALLIALDRLKLSYLLASLVSLTLRNIRFIDSRRTAT